VNAAAASRRYVLLTFLLWLPTGLYLPPLVLLMLDRGLSVGAVAVVGAAYSLTVALLELPTGGLADVVGRRPVLVASTAASAAGLLLLGLADTFTLFVASAMLRGVARALSTGPLEAWYVDTVHAALGRDADLTAGLARGEVAASVALAAGTLTGGLLPLALPAAGPVPALAVPVLLAAGVEVVRATATLRLPEPPHPRPGWGAVVRGVPATVVAGLRLAGGDRVLTRVLLAAGGAGVALAVVELLTPAWLAELTGTRQAGAATYALVAAAGFAVDALGSALGPALVRRCGTPARAAAVATAVGALGLVLVGLAGAAGLRGAGAVLAAAVAYCLLFAGLGAAAPAQGQLLHDRVGAAARATVVSGQSLLLQLAAAAGVTVLGWLAGRHGLWTGFAVGAAVLLASAALFVRLPTASAVAAHDPLGDGGEPAGDGGEPVGDGGGPAGRGGVR
jgi:hypothetical protein